jgi:hypothetical protein
MPNERPADYFRDDWFDAMSVETERRGWSFKVIASTEVIRLSVDAHVGILRDNNSFRLDIPKPNVSSKTSAEDDCTRAQTIWGLLHASEKGQSWGVGETHVTNLANHSQRTGESFAVILLDGHYDRGFVLWGEDAYRAGTAGGGTIQIQRKEAFRHPQFDSITSCVDLIANPGSAGQIRTISGPHKSTCSECGTFLRRESGKWLCPKCGRTEP